jgi:hypothetical protein
MKEDFGVAAMVKGAVWLDATVGMEVLHIGRSATGPEDCAMDICGSQLLVRISLQGGWLWLSACGLDEAAGPEPICNFPDTPRGWRDVCRLVQALERSGLASLKERPIHIGDPGSRDAYCID